MTRASRIAAAVLLVVGSLGCGDDAADTGSGARTAPEPERGQGPEGHSPSVPAQEPRPERPLAQVARLTGPVAAEGPALRLTGPVPVDVPLEVGPDALLGLALRDGGRVDLEANSSALLAGEGPAVVVLARGNLHAVLPPAGNAARPPFHVALPSATVEIGGSGELWVTQLPSGRAWVAVLGGTVDIMVGDLDAEGRPVRRTFVAGQAYTLGGSQAEPAAAPGSLDEVRAQAAGIVRRDRPPRDAQITAGLADDVTALDETLEALGGELARGSRLADEHRSAVAARSERARELQRELVGHSQQMFRMRQAALVRWERVLARVRWLAVGGAAPDPDPTAARRARVRELLGR